MRKEIRKIGEKVLEGEDVGMKEVLPLLGTKGPDILDLAAVANRVKAEFNGNEIDLCSLLNVKSGRCSEDCVFCAQSGHYKTEAPVYPLMDMDRIVEEAREAQMKGTGRFCLITSGRELNDKEFETILRALGRIRKETTLDLDCSLGTLSEERAESLKKVGITRYNHNIETSESHFPQICSTHSFGDRVKTIGVLKDRGFSICCGGIIGLGESPQQRLELAFSLRQLGIDCIPFNILNPRPGTPLEHSESVPPMEIIKTIALFRLILPKGTIKIAGGREANLRDLQCLALLAGANGLILGNYLTTLGRSAEDDLTMIRDLGLTIK
ncbi:MAG: biotin synthase BioB [Deltaproteobacteria bacterium RBG_16_47_11]|nr:MAG: biotin synthase BioB [Deltaproteobacteria bacterium RBG_16_47_11]